MNDIIAKRLELKNTEVLIQKRDIKKIGAYVPEYLENVLKSLHQAGVENWIINSVVFN